MLFKENDLSNNKAYVVLTGKVVVLRKNREEENINKKTDNEDLMKIEKKPVLTRKISFKKTSSSQSPLIRTSFRMSIRTPYIPPIGSKSQRATRYSIRSNRNVPGNLENYDDEAAVAADLESKMAQIGDLVATIEEGSMFGEVALVSDNPRNASIFLMEDSEFMTLRQEEFDIIKKLYNKEFSLRRKFFYNIFPLLEFVKDDKKISNFLQFFQPISLERVISNLIF